MLRFYDIDFSYSMALAHNLIMLPVWVRHGMVIRVYIYIHLCHTTVSYYLYLLPTSTSSSLITFSPPTYPFPSPVPSCPYPDLSCAHHLYTTVPLTCCVLTTTYHCYLHTYSTYIPVCIPGSFSCLPTTHPYLPTTSSFCYLLYHTYHHYLLYLYAHPSLYASLPW